MYLQSGVDYYITNFEGIRVVCKSGLVLTSPKFKFKLLSYPDMNKINIMLSSGMKEADINDEIVSNCLLSIVGFEEEELDLNESPAGVVDHLATKIRLNSELLVKDIEKTYETMTTVLDLYERLSLVVAHFTNNTYEFTQKLPIDELIKRYTLCSLCFPTQVPPIAFEKEEESKVG